MDFNIFYLYLVVLFQLALKIANKNKTKTIQNVKTWIKMMTKIDTKINKKFYRFCK